MGDGSAGEEADVGIVPALGNVVARLEPILFPAQLASGSCREVVRQCKKDLGAERLEQGPPRLARQCGFQGTDALRRDNRNTTRLSRETEELFIARWLVLSNGGEVLVFVAEKQDLAKVPVAV